MLWHLERKWEEGGNGGERGEIKSINTKTKCRLKWKSNNELAKKFGMVELKKTNAQKLTDWVQMTDL